MPGAGYRLVSYSTREDRTPRAGILLGDTVTDARTVLGSAACSVLGILRDWESASERLDGFAGSRGLGPARQRHACGAASLSRNVLLRGRELLGPPA